jgi:hypothetical protein
VPTGGWICRPPIACTIPLSMASVVCPPTVARGSVRNHVGRAACDPIRMQRSSSYATARAPTKLAENEEEEIELSDDDLVEVTPAQPKSGTYALGLGEVRPEHVVVPTDALPRLGSISDGVETNVNIIVEDLARLSDPSRTPRPRGEVDWASLDPSEAWMLSIVESRMTIGAIVEMSPHGEEETLRLLARLVSLQVVSIG